MECNYYLINPTNNITILVESQFDTEVQPFIAEKLLEIEPTAEQVGFIIDEKSEQYDIKVRMSGGEFCGNACMAAALVYYSKANNSKDIVDVSMSGCSEIIKVEISDNRFCVNMPKSEKIELINTKFENSHLELPIVHFKGISHIIYKGKFENKSAERFVKFCCKELKKDAVGIMFVDDSFTRITPLVYVKESNTLYWENSCASGTTAVGEYLRFLGNTCFTKEFIEPGGNLKVICNDCIKLEGSCFIEKYDTCKI